MSDAQNPAEVVRTHMARYVGPFTSRNAVKMMAKQTFGVEPEQITREQIPPLLDALGPILRTLLGKSGADATFAEIRADLRL